EGDTELVPDGLEDTAALLLDEVAQESIVARQGYAHRGGVFFPQPGAPLDIRKQERDRPGRQCGHERPLSKRKRPALSAVHPRDSFCNGQVNPLQVAELPEAKRRSMKAM